MSTNKEQKYWFNLTTGEVEQGYLSPSVDRAGPYDSREEAARAMEVIRARSAQWREDDESE